MTATSEDGYTPAYTLDNTWRAARDRLTHLEEALDPYTAQHLDKVGVRPRWHCLEVGAGGGSVVRMLCDRVGPEGRVLAVDLEPALLADLSAPNLEVRRVDVVVDDLPEAAFHLVHARAVLMHIPQREEVIPRLVQTLRPGGILLLEEMDLTPCFEAGDIVTRTTEAIYRPIFEAGMDLRWANSMPERLQAAGLVDLGGARDLLTFTGNSPLARFYDVTWLQLLESQEYTDAERAQIEDGRAAMLQPGGPWVAWDMVTAWGRRP